MSGIAICVDACDDPPGSALVSASVDMRELLRRYLADDPALTPCERTAAGMLAASLAQGGAIEPLPLAS